MSTYTMDTVKTKSLWRFAKQPTEGLSMRQKEQLLLELHSEHPDEELWMVLDGKVLDVTKFVHDHPGGKKILLYYAGMDATKEFEDIGHSLDARQWKKDFEIGVLLK